MEMNINLSSPGIQYPNNTLLDQACIDKFKLIIQIKVIIKV